MELLYVYVLSNESYPDTIKIGVSKNPTARAKDMSRSVPTPYVVEFACTYSNAKEVEQSAHEYFSGCRRPGKEFFDVSVSDAIEYLVDQVHGDPKITNINASLDFYTSLSDSITRATKRGVGIEIVTYALGSVAIGLLTGDYDDEKN